MKKRDILFWLVMGAFACLAVIFIATPLRWALLGAFIGIVLLASPIVTLLGAAWLFLELRNRRDP